MFIDNEAVQVDNEASSSMDVSESRDQLESDNCSFIDDSEQPEHGNAFSYASGLLPNVNIKSRATSSEDDYPIVMMDSGLDSDSQEESGSENAQRSIFPRKKKQRQHVSSQAQVARGELPQPELESSSSESSASEKDKEYEANEDNTQLEPENPMDNRLLKCTSPANQNSLLESIQARLSAKLIPRTRAILVRRNIRPVRRGRPKGTSQKVVSLPYADEWALTLTKYERSFWCSDEARLGNTDRFAKASMGYKAVSIHEKNNKDLELIYELSVKPKEDTGKEVKWFSQFKLAVGQFVRMCVSTQAINRQSLDTLCERGALFKLTAFKNVGQVFVDYFKIRGTVTTVMNKSRLIKKLCDFALDYGERRYDSETIASIREMAKLMNSTCNAHKAMYKFEARSNQRADFRAEEGGWLAPEDFRMIVLKCKAQLQSIMDNFLNLRADTGGELEFFEFCKGTEGLIQKYNMNFITYLVLIAGGQRPQVYASLMHPSYTEMEEMEASAVSDKLFTMRTDNEKKLRPSDAPYVGFRAEAFPYIDFFVKRVRPTILRLVTNNIRSGKELISAGAFRTMGIEGYLTIYDQDHNLVKDSDALDKYIDRLSMIVGAPLIIHTRSARSLTTKQITRTVQQCIGAIDPELGTISVMKIRCAFATNAILEHKEALAENSTDMCADEYLENLAKTMNTSVEMLKNVYITVDPGMIMHSLKNVYSVFQ